MSNFTIYRSSAGSGKTYTLVKEYLKLILVSNHPHVFRKILAITFTNKAASELKDRILKQLQGLAGIDKTFKDEELRLSLCRDMGINADQLAARSAEILQAMLYNYTDLAISTIDKFVVKILRYFNKELGVHPDFSVELNMNELLSRSIERVLSSIGRDKTMTEMAMGFAQDKTEGDRSWRIEKDLNDIAKLLKEEESHDALKVLENTEEKILLDQAKVLRKELKELKKQIEPLRERAIEILDSAPEAHEVMIVKVMKFFREIGVKRKYKTKYPSDSLMAKLESDTWHKKVPAKKAHLARMVDGLRIDLFPIFEKAMHLKRAILTKKMVLDSFNPLMFSKRISFELEKIKDEQNLVLLNDNNRMIAEIVRNNPSPFIYEKLGEQYRHFLIDEFQDTSIVQWHNLIPLVEESLGMGNKNIIVGDSKQSIYRFRGGEMEQLAALPKVYNGEAHHQITEAAFRNSLDEQRLEFNYRSKKEVVEFNNSLFSFLLENKRETCRELYHGFEQKVHKDGGGVVAMSILDERDDDLLLDEIIRIIEHSVSLGYSYGDIAVLVYKNDIGSLVAEHCKTKNIPVVSSESLLLKNHQEVGFLVAVIKHLTEPENSAHRLTILQYLHPKDNRGMTMDAFLKENIKAEDFGSVFGLLDVAFDKNAFLQLDVYALVEVLCKLFRINTAEAYLLEFLNTCSSFVRKEGLEFPVVINPYYFKKIKKFSRKYLWVEDEEADVAVQLLKTVDQGLETNYANLFEEEKYKTSIDQLNVLYVAVTRATEMLHLILSPVSAKVRKEQPERLDCLLLSFAERKLAREEKLQWGEFLEKKNRHTKKDLPVRIGDYDRMNWRTDLKIAISDELKGEELVFGNRLHDLLAEINSKEEIEAVLDERAVVVDFKTGTERTSHDKQVKAYRDALEQMGYAPVEGYLLYTNNMMLKQVE